MHIEAIIGRLQKERFLFHSEADFQHALAWEIQRYHRSAKVRLEINLVGSLEPREATDILVKDGEMCYAIELKYRKKKIDVECSNEKFCLREHSATDEGRYYFVEDICRLEHLVETRDSTIGYAIFLTNDTAYWKVQQKRKQPPNDQMFRIHEGCVLKETLSWGKPLKRRAPLTLKGSYGINWDDYSTVGTEGAGKFRYIILKVAKPFCLSATDPTKAVGERAQGIT
jgi:hypothetical protein